MPDLQSELSKIAQAWDADVQTTQTPSQTTINPPAKTQPTQEKAVDFNKTGVVSLDTFNYIRANDGKYPQVTVAKMVSALGYKYNSVQSIITQMKKVGMIGETESGTLYIKVSEYTPFKNPYLKPEHEVNKKAKAEERRKAKALAKARAKARAKRLAEKEAEQITIEKTKEILRAGARNNIGIAALQPDTTLTVSASQNTTIQPQYQPAPLTAQAVLRHLSVGEAHALYVELSKMFGGAK